MEQQFLYYALCVLAIVVAVWAVKKITGCVIKLIIVLLLLALLAYGYLMMN